MFSTTDIDTNVRNVYRKSQWSLHAHRVKIQQWHQYRKLTIWAQVTGRGTEIRPKGPRAGVGFWVQLETSKVTTAMPYNVKTIPRPE